MYWPSEESYTELGKKSSRLGFAMWMYLRYFLTMAFIQKGNVRGSRPPVTGGLQLWLGCHRTMVLLNIEQLGKRCLRPNPHLICGHLKRIKHADNQTGSSHLHIPLFQFQSLGRIMWQFFKIPFQDIVLLIMYSEISSHREHPYTVAHKWLPPPLSSGVRCFIMTGTRIVTAHIFTLSVLLCTFPHLITTLQKIIFFIIDSD